MRREEEILDLIILRVETYDKFINFTHNLMKFELSLTVDLDKSLRRRMSQKFNKIFLFFKLWKNTNCVIRRNT